MNEYAAEFIAEFDSERIFEDQLNALVCKRRVHFQNSVASHTNLLTFIADAVVGWVRFGNIFCAQLLTRFFLYHVV